MSKKLAGTLFVYNGIQHDYCFVEAIKCLLEFCNHVFVVDAGSNDGTKEVLLEMNLDKITLIFRNDWEEVKGKEKLNFFTNIAIKKAQEEGYEYQFNLQADEIVHEKSYFEIINCLHDSDEGYMCKRINLWSSPYMQLDVPLSRMPCSTSIVRLTKTKYRSYDDAENVGVPLVNTYFEGGIRIYHMGFVRRREVMKSKIINMQCNVFGMEHYDAKLDQAEIFNPDLWFHPQNDLRPIDEPLPKLIQEWAKERVVFN